MLQQLKENPLVPVLRKIAFEDSISIIDSLVEGGVRFIEITLDTDRALEIIRQAAERVDEVWVGAGTVLSIDDCKHAIEGGAQFIVSPVLDEGVVNYAVEQGIPVIPGVHTPTEMMKAHQMGATAVKLFPAASLGPGFVKDVRGPLGHIPIMVTGGIDLETARSYIEAGALAIGAGSALLKKDLIDGRKWVGLAKEAKSWVREVKQVPGSH